MVNGITEYGKTIKTRLLEMEKTQAWLVDEVAKKTGLFFDSSYLHKVMTGRLHTPKVIAAIDEILGVN